MDFPGQFGIPKSDRLSPACFYRDGETIAPGLGVATQMFPSTVVEQCGSQAVCEPVALSQSQRLDK